MQEGCPRGAAGGGGFSSGGSVSASPASAGARCPGHQTSGEPKFHSQVRLPQASAWESIKVLSHTPDETEEAQVEKKTGRTWDPRGQLGPGGLGSQSSFTPSPTAATHWPLGDDGTGVPSAAPRAFRLSSTKR